MFGATVISVDSKTSPSVDLTANLGDSGFQTKWLLDTVLANDRVFGERLKPSQITKVSVDRVGDGKGFCSRLYRIAVGFDDQQPDYTFIAKVPTGDLWPAETAEQKAQHCQRVGKMHQTECDMYFLLGHLPNVPRPKLYFSDERLILMEDRSNETVALSLLDDSVGEPMARKFANVIANFQADVDLMPDRQWEGHFNDCLGTAPEICELFRKEFNAVMELRNGEMKSILADWMKLDFKEVSDYLLVQTAKDFGHSTLCHGDLWTGNILFKRKPDGTADDNVDTIIDWQTVFEGNPLYDLCTFVASSMDTEIRRSVEKDLIREYWNRLNERYSEWGKPAPFSFQKAVEFYELSIIYLIIMFTGCFLIVTEGDVHGDRSELLWQRMRGITDDGLKYAKKFGIFEKFTQK